MTQDTPASNAALRKWLPWTVAGVAVLALAVVLLNQRSDDPRDAQIERLQERLDAIDGGAGKSSTSSRRSANVGSHPMPDAGVTNAAKAYAEEFRSMTPQQREAELKRRHAQLQAQFEADSRDPAGSRPAITHLEDTVVGQDMASTGLVPQDISVDCRANLCRVAGEFAKAGDAEDWAMMYLSAAGGEIERAQTVQVPQPDGSTQIIIYGTRGERPQP